MLLTHRLFLVLVVSLALSASSAVLAVWEQAPRSLPIEKIPRGSLFELRSTLEFPVRQRSIWEQYPVSPEGERIAGTPFARLSRTLYCRWQLSAEPAAIVRLAKGKVFSFVENEVIDHTFKIGLFIAASPSSASIALRGDCEVRSVSAFEVDQSQGSQAPPIDCLHTYCLLYGNDHCCADTTVAGAPEAGESVPPVVGDLYAIFRPWLAGKTK